MTGIPFSMPLTGVRHPVIGHQAVGAIAEQRAAMERLLAKAGWAEPHREDTGRPRMGGEFCSLSHGGGWAVAARHDKPIGIDVESESERLHRTAPRFCGPLDEPVLAHFGQGTATLCRLWTAKEAAFKAFGTSVDFLTGIRWDAVHDHGAHLHAVQQGLDLELTWEAMPAPPGPAVWLAVAVVR